ncbi:MAG: signal peptide peptidase SppA [Coriobacteriia bacterium]|nr:signal peptide peptidase SppA [Coriobacteriia bacterium]
MSDPTAPQQPEYQQPPARPAYEQAAPQYAPAYAAPYMPQPQPERKRHGWIWALVVLAIVAMILGSCVWSIVYFGGTSDTKLTTGETVAVIPIDSVIAGGGAAGYITPEYFLEQIEKAEDDDNVKAIVLRVDSPGGTVAASEEIATYVKECPKPVVVSIGDVGASGAYMISSQAKRIFALPGSAVGSIGVITEIPNVSGLLDKVGVDFTVVTAGKNKDTGSPYRPLTKEEKALIQGSVNQVYEQFIDIVAEGRGLERSKVEVLATGWAWNGDEALKLGLVDEIGTYRDALDAAAKLGGIEGDYDTVTYGASEIEDLLNTLTGISEQLGPIGALGSAATQRQSPALAK